MNDLWYGTSGPQNARIVLVGESWGFEEAQAKQPFVGSSGTELNRMLAEAGIQRDSVLCTNVVADRPQQNEMFRFFQPKDNKPLRIDGIAPQPIVQNEIARLYQQIAAHPRDLVIAVGNWSLWALAKGTTKAKTLRETNGRKIAPELQTWAPTGIQAWRGSMWYMRPHDEILQGASYSETLRATRLLPIIHPAAIMRDWAQRTPTVHDLKTRVPMALRGDWRRNPAPTYLAPPTLVQLRERILGWLNRANAGERIYLSEDIETARGLITCLGVSDGPGFAMSIPFIQRIPDSTAFVSWWQPAEEGEIVHLLRLLNSHPNILIIGQNFIYDTQYIQHWMGVTPKLHWDTMLCQNVIFPGTPKDLSYLSSLYCDYHWYWKEDHKEWDLSGTVEDLLLYNCEDNIRTHNIAMSQMQLVKHLGQEAQMAFKMQTNDLCLRMMNRGVLLGQQRREQVRMELNQALHEIQCELLQIIPQDLVRPHDNRFSTMWYNSPQQIATLLYDILCLPEQKHRKTGSRTTGKEALDVLRRKAPIWTHLYNLLDKLGSVEQALSICNIQAESDLRLRCSYNPGGAETHRLSSSKNVFGRGTNLQNLSKGEEDE